MNYRIQSCCDNCVHSAETVFMDDPPQLHCTFGSPRPDRDVVGYSVLWEWEDKRRVDDTGVCDNHAPDPEAWTVNSGTEIT